MLKKVEHFFVIILLLIGSNSYAQEKAISNLFEEKNYEAVKQQLLPAYEKEMGLPTIEVLQKGCANQVLLVKVLVEEFSTLMKQEGAQDALLKRAEDIDRLVLYILNTVALQKDKTNILKELLAVYGGAQELCKKLYDQKQDKTYLEKAFYFAEQYKSILLKDALREQEALSFGGVDAGLRKDFQELKLLIGEFNKEIMAERLSFPVDEKKIEALSDSVAKKSLKLEQLYTQLEQDFRQYAALKNSRFELSTKVIQEELLDERSAFLEYSMTNERYFLYILTKNSVKWLELPTQDSVHKLLASFVKVMITPKQETLADYLEKGYLVYQLLMKEALENLPQEVDRLIIAPDGKLHNLPFDVLVYKNKTEAEVEDFSQVPYLLEKYIVSYSYSTALLKENKGKTSQESDKLLGVAADYSGMTAPKVNELRSGRTAAIRKALAPLPFAQQEVEKLENIFEGKFLFGEEASESNFKRMASQYPVIHLAMHGLADSENPELSALAFTENFDEQEDNILYLHEINSLKLKADLVVLSACETGIGSFQAGAGVMSVASSFMYAGASSVIMTLWPVSDQATQIIMEDFYALLGEGDPKDLALHKAKLNYIQNVGDLKIAAHPVFWGPYIQLGDNRAVTLPQNTEALTQKEQKFWLWLGIVAVGLILVIGLAIFFKRKKSSASN